MRFSTQMMYQQNMRGITNSQAEWMKYGEQMSTGKRVVNPSDDPIAASQAVVLSQAQAQNSQYTLARTFAIQKVSLEESVLSQVTTAIQNAQEKIVYASNGTLSDDDRASLATDIQGLRDQLLNLANTTDGNGRYIFAGYKTETAPFSEEKGKYVGGAESIKQQVDASRSMVIGHTGDKIFDSITSNAVAEPDGSASETNLFAMLDSAIAALKTPVADSEADKEIAAAALDKTNRGLKNSLNNVLAVRAELGTQLNELESLDSLGSDRALGQTQWLMWTGMQLFHLTSCSKRHCRHRIKHLPICRDCRSSSSTNKLALKHIMKLGMFCLPAQGSPGRAFFLPILHCWLARMPFDEF